MSNLINDFSKTKDKLIQLSEKKAKKEGKKEQLLSDLHNMFDISTLKDAKESLLKLVEDADISKKELKEILNELNDIVKDAE